MFGTDKKSDTKSGEENEYRMQVCEWGEIRVST